MIETFDSRQDALIGHGGLAVFRPDSIPRIHTLRDFESESFEGIWLKYAMSESRLDDKGMLHPMDILGEILILILVFLIFKILLFCVFFDIVCNIRNGGGPSKLDQLIAYLRNSIDKGKEV